jgi:hypothetical protein
MGEFCGDSVRGIASVPRRIFLIPLVVPSTLGGGPRPFNELYGFVETGLPEGGVEVPEEGFVPLLRWAPGLLDDVSLSEACEERDDEEKREDNRFLLFALSTAASESLRH